MQTIESARVPVFEDLADNPKRRKKIQLHLRQWQRLTAIAKAEGRGLSEVCEHFLTWAEEDWRKSTRPHKLAAYLEFLSLMEQSQDDGGEDDEGPAMTPAPLAGKKNSRR